MHPEKIHIDGNPVFVSEMGLESPDQRRLPKASWRHKPRVITLISEFNDTTRLNIAVDNFARADGLGGLERICLLAASLADWLEYRAVPARDIEPNLADPASALPKVLSSASGTLDLYLKVMYRFLMWIPWRSSFSVAGSCS